MMKKFMIAATAALSIASLASADTMASERYRKVAPVVVGDSLTAPWVNQLGSRRGKVVAPVSTGGAFNSTGRVIRYTQPQQRTALARPAPQQKPAQRQMDPRFLPQTVDYQTSQKPGSIIIDTNQRFLYLVLGDGKARRYGVGVGKPGFEWAGSHKVTAKKEWPSWTPPKEMIAREAAKGHYLPNHMEGGPANPLGARAMYLGSTLYRIHGTNAPWTIGYAVSSGCIRMRNEDVVDLYERVKVGTKVTVI